MAADRAYAANVSDDVLRMQKASVFVLGDLILDTYVSGKVSRISPEAPVPVVLEEKKWAVLGGAANAAANIAGFGALVYLAGRIGSDVDGDTFRALCKNLHIDTSYVVVSSGTPTTRKLRVMAGYQQVVRIDSETLQALAPPEEGAILAGFRNFAAQKAPKALVISDYGKGVCSVNLLGQLIREAEAAKIPVITDPKSSDMKRYAGTTIMKPNLSEGREMLKAARPGVRFEQFEEEVNAVCEAVLSGSGSSNVVLSLSEKGVTLRGKDVASPVNFKSMALQVADVSGAGDTMVAFLAMGMAASIGIERSVQFANIASGIVCGKLGTATVNASEFMESFKHATEETSPEKLVDRDELAAILEQSRARGKSVVFTNGCFDLLHAGHIESLQKSKSFGDVLVVALNSDASVQRLKGPTRPLQNQNDRARIMAALSCVDYVTIFDEETPLELIQKLRPNVLVKGGDYTVATIVGAKEVLGWGGRVEIISLVPGRSTTSLVEKSRKP